MTLIVIRLQSGSSQTEPVGIGFPPREGSNNPHINVCKAVPVRINGCFYQEHMERNTLRDILVLFVDSLKQIIWCDES